MTRPHLASALTSAGWLGSVLAMSALALLIVLAFPLLNESGGDARSVLAEGPLPRPWCGLWDDQASAAIADRVRESKRDEELRQLADAIFRLRRARRNCAEGWVGVACRDYHAIMRSVSGPSDARPLLVAPAACGRGRDGVAHTSHTGKFSP